jgi:hypothetical protein
VRRFVVEDPTEYKVLNFTTEGAGTLSISGNNTDTVTMYKLTGGGRWNVGALETTGFVPPVTVEFDKTANATEEPTSRARISLDADNNNQGGSWDQFDWAAHPAGTTSQWQVWHNGAGIQLSSVSWTNADKKYLVYGTDGTIKHYSGSTLMYETSVGDAGTATRYLRLSFYSANSTDAAYSNIRVRKQTWNGSAYV